MSLYLKILLCSFCVPFLFSFHSKIQFFKYFKIAFLSISSVSFFFIFWDIIYTDLKVWGFNEKHHSKLLFFKLPLEEILFFYVIPFCCLFTYFVFRKFNFSIRDRLNNYKIIFSVLLFLLAILNYSKLYTFSVCMLSAVIFLMERKPSYWWGTFILTYFVITLIPFLIVNGLLTGFLHFDNPPVWYNPNHMLGFRFFTIPFEDFFYNFILLYLNFYIFEFYCTKFKMTLVVSPNDKNS